MRFGVIAGLVALSLGSTAVQAATLAPGIAPGTENSLVQEVAVSSDTVRLVQQRLAALGYHVGPIDGIAGARTRAAVRAYEADHGLPVTGDVYVLAAQFTTTQSTAAVQPTIEPYPYYRWDYGGYPYYRWRPGPTVGLFLGPAIGFALRGGHGGPGGGGRGAHFRSGGPGGGGAGPAGRPPMGGGGGGPGGGGGRR